jgi:hypothetical protein
MPRTCTVCSHDEAHVINVELVASGGNRRIASQYGLSEAAVRRHRQEHIPELLVKASEAVERAAADDLLIELRAIRDNLIRLSDLAEANDDYRTAIGGNVARLKYAELLAKVSQIIDERPQVNLYLSPEWLELRAVIVTALEPHPEARDDVLSALGNGAHHDGG